MFAREWMEGGRGNSHCVIKQETGPQPSLYLLGLCPHCWSPGEGALLQGLTALVGVGNLGVSPGSAGNFWCSRGPITLTCLDLCFSICHLGSLLPPGLL